MKTKMKNTVLLCALAIVTTVLTGCEPEESAPTPFDPNSCVRNPYRASNPVDTNMDDNTLVGLAESGGIGRCYLKYASNPDYGYATAGRWLLYTKCVKDDQKRENYTNSLTVNSAAGLLRANILNGNCYKDLP